MGCSSAPAGDVQPRAVGKVAQAVWSNGDFENDAIGLTPPSGWTVTNYTNPSGVSGSSSSVPSSFSALNLTAGGKTETYVVGGTAESQIDPDLGAGQPFRFPKYGSRGVRVNYKDATDTGKNRNANALRQTMTVTASDTDPFDGLLHVRFVIAPVLENPSHGYTQQPYYFVELKNLTTGAALYQDFNTAGQSGVPWKTTTSVLTGNTLQWTDWQLVDVVPESGLSIGDSVQLTIIGSGCSLSGHFGRVYVDGMGSTVPGLYTWANGPSSVAPNGDIQYTVYYYNGAATTANGAHFDMQTPPQTTYRSVSGLSNCTGPAQGSTGTLVCPIGNVAPGGSGLFTVTVRANGSASGTITNGNYSIAAINSSPLLGSKVRTSVLGSGTSTADVHVTVTAANAVDWAGTMTYTIVVRNTGANSLSSSQINIVDAFPSQLTNVTWTCTENSTFWAACNGASGSGAINAHPTLSYFFGIGGQVTYTVTGTVISGSGLGSISNTVTATVSGGRTDPNTDDNKVTTVTGIGTPRTLTFTKTGSSSSGSVTSIPSGLSCGTGCSGSSPIFADNTVLTLTASPIPGATFTGWGGACSGTASTCSVTMDAAKSVSAGFAAPPVAGAAANVAVVSGSGQLARTGNAFGSSLVAYVTDAAGTPVNGATVTFTVPATGASAALSSTTATSNSSGLATITTATANATAGSYNVVATVPSGTTSASFALTNVGAPASITYVSGGTATDPNTAPINTAFNAPLMVLLKDVNGNVVPGATVTYTVPASGASATLSSASATSDSSGYASVTATANGTVGAYTVSAATAGVASTVGFSLSNIANAPASVFVVSGNNQSIAPSNAFDDPFVVGVADSVGNPLKNVTVTFAAPGSGARATLAGSPATTNALGQAQVTATANATVGTYSVTASVAGVSTPATFTLTNTGSNYINVYSGSDQAVSIGSAFTSLVARVTNGSGAAVSGVVVTFAAPSSGASATLATPVTATTDASGLATKALTANTVAGSYVVTATTPTAGLPASFSLTNEAGAATSLTLTSGSSQHTRVTTDFPLALTATLKDASNNPVSGGTVTFTPPASGATAVVTGSPATTDSNGQAIVTVVAGATAGGPYNVTATSGALSAIQFALTNDECAADSDCTTAQFCNTATYTCAAKLSNGTAIPTIANHSPALAGTCSVAVGSAVCAAGVCSTTDNKCGLPNGEGTCTSGTAATVCRSSACSVSNVCMASGGCAVVGDCSLSHATAGCVSGACTIASCSAGYGNCNGTVSDGCEVQTAGSDVTNCGGCGTTCSYAHAGATCTAGSCGMGSCSAGYGNCDGNAANGCETQTNASDVNNCGGCGTVCSYAHAGATCTAGSCGMGSCSAGYADCNSSAADGCEKQINGSDVNNCGGCGTVCSFAHAGAACSAGTCAMGSCSPGYADCDGNPANGCEVQTAGSDASNCGGCGTMCSYAHAGATCTAGSCGMGSCSAGYADCNTSAADGCEKQINGSDVSNCGACGNTCSFAHAGATCSAGTCAMGSCSAGYADCDGNPANGCEVQINASDVGNCGACGNTCSYAHSGASCSAGTCAMGSCSAGYADCDASAADGCEVQTAGSDVGNCGSCGNACSYAHAGASCSSGTCVMGSCGAGYEDCNGSASDGCEIQTAGSDVGNCGSCGNVCSYAHAGASCASGTCAMGSCSAGYADCNGSAADGCEVRIDASDVSNCGACGNVCSYAHAGATCSAGSCAMGSCSAGYADCNGSAADGCEVQIDASDVGNCGACGNTCSYANAAASCNGGTCAMASCSTGYEDCDGSAANGCEIRTNGSDVSNCGACGNACTYANAGASCAAGSCMMGSCSAGYEDCNGSAADGCEIRTNGSDVSNCGACGNACSYANAGASCAAGSCVMGSCAAGYEDCDAGASNGCEVQTAGSDVSNCGACGNTCSYAHAGATCSAGTCAMGSCAPGYADCNGLASDGCEVQTDTDASHCGVCGNVCSYANAGAACSGGFCGMTTCSTGYADCNSSSSDGCEVQTAGTDASNCGACGNVCSYAHAGASCAAGTCAMGSCSAGYADCNGSAADGCEVQTAGTDAGNCGACGNACSYAHAGASCSAGSCSMGSCNPGYADCNGSAADGCEVQIDASDVSNCGACGNTCSYANAGASCNSGTCAMGSCSAGYEDCDGSAANGCEIRTNGSDVGNCGACGNACSYAHAGASCTVGTCAMGSCSAGYEDCNGSAADGCEVPTAGSDVNNCGSCGDTCSYAHAGASCAGGTCAMGSCAPGYADCNGLASDGCEVQTDTDVSDCGVCGNVCSYANAGAACSSGFCAMTTCSSGYADCDSSSSNGCEVQTAGSDVGNCGACGNTCSYAHAGATCSAGSCGIGSCDPGYANCNGSAADGCEVQIDATDVNNCGACGSVCSYAHAGASCSSGTCARGSCDAGYDDCNGSAADGCEAPLATDAGNCGACGSVCSYAHAAASCSGGSCSMGSCAPGYEDCNGSATDGCEAPLDTDVANCGTCGSACSYAHAAATCASGKCGMGTCAAGYEDCNGNAADGCEAQMATDTVNCGSCGTVCAYANAAASCSSGTCAMAACSPGYEDCNASETDGCEVQTAGSDVSNCGGCGTICAYAHAGAMCIGGACALAACDLGFEDCNANAADGCETQTSGADVANCGGCGTACSPAHASGLCAAGSCGIGSCNAGYADCDGNAANGCEAQIDGADVNNCGGCGSTCALAHAGAACSAGSCTVATCNAGYADCDGVPADGCEVQTAGSDVSNCGGCGTRCAPAHAGGVCTTGSCGVASCDAGYGDCDSNAANGCEVQTGGSDLDNCGGCGTLCAPAHASGACTTGSCGIGSCDPGYADCDGNAANGCELQIGGSDVNNCGGCGTVCAFAHAGATCTAGVCGMTTCSSGFANCDAQSADGCEVDTNSDVGHCGSCGTACSFAHAAASCNAGSCAMGACAANHADCNGSASDGCEIDTTSDANHCGMCGTVCSFAHAAASCTASSCTLAGCAAGYANCDSNPANGCEMLTDTSHDNCGACGNACSAAQYCATGTCTARKPNGDGCADAGECASGVCNADMLCGDPNGHACSEDATCRGGACSKSGLCMDSGQCLVDDDCASSKFCDTSLSECTDKLPNGAPVPAISGHTPDLAGACTADVGEVVCSSSVCDVRDHECGYDNGGGSCDGSNAASVCRSGVCGADSECGYPDGEGPCTVGDQTLVCRSGLCNPSTSLCTSTPGCVLDTDCTPAQFCDTSTGSCTQKLNNGIMVPAISGHTPALTGACTTDVGRAVCAESVCDSNDDKCGFDNGDGLCDDSTSSPQCRSAVCGSDDKCGYPDGEGPCTSVDASTVCRSGVCSAVSHVCVAPSGCAIDADCSSSQFCDSSKLLCTAKLKNGVILPKIAKHTPALTGMCSKSVAVSVCKSAVCDATDDKCGYRNGEGSCSKANAGLVCRSGVCGGDGKCGLRDGESTCNSTNAGSVCRSGDCSKAHVCVAPSGCAVDADCTSAQFCDNGSGECRAKLDDGVALPVVDGHTPALSGMCSSSAGKIVCKSGVCDADDDKCGFANDAGSCTQATAGDVCRSRACGSDGKCGFPDGEGSCTVTTASNLCRSGVCMNDVCGPAPGCTSDKSCEASEYCSSEASCAPKKRDGKPCGADNQCTSNSCNAETHVCNSCIDGTCGKLKLSGGGCSTSGTPGTSGELPGSLLVLLAATLILRGRRRRAASV